MKKLLIALMFITGTASAELGNCSLYNTNLFSSNEFLCWQSTKLVALKDKTTTSGSFGVFLLVGGGNFQQNWIVRFAVEDENGFAELKEMSYSEVRIKEYDGPPTVKRLVKVQDNETSEYFDIWHDHKYYLFVPKGSIESSYKIDLE